MPDPSQPAKKIIVDEDWKSQVEAERQAAEAATATAGPSSAGGSAQRPPLPQPDLIYLGTSLYYQAMIAMGAVRTSHEEAPPADLELAQHLIDTIAMLQEKTAGNRTPEETETFEELLHQLRMAFIAVQQSGGSAIA